MEHYLYHIHQDSQLEVLLRKLLKKIDLLNRKLEIFMATIQELQSAVTRNTEVEDSVLVLLRGISQQLKDAQASGDPAALDAVVAQLDASTQKLAAAVTENTPAQP